MARISIASVSTGRQRGVALIAALVLVMLIGITAILAVARGTDGQAEKDRHTRKSLALAKEALIGFAASINLTGPERPGDLPCPDTDNDGVADPPCSTAVTRLGRLPWRTLGLPDLRDGDGERLWYALSDNFKNNPRTNCSTHADAGCLNSNTLGTISVRDANNNLVHDAAATSGVVALVIAPGGILSRTDNYVQDRDKPTDQTAKNYTAKNYLDILGAIGEDNADFADGTQNGLIVGPIVDGAGRVIVNDLVTVISMQDILPPIERRVAQEVAVCLNTYAASSGGRYPWAADTLESGLNDRYHDYQAPAARRYGRIPDPPFNRTTGDGPAMSSNWPTACKLALGAWWTNWKSLVFYSVAEAYQPASGPPACGTCLTVNLTAGPAVTTAQYVVMVAGQQLAGQDRSAPPGTVNTNPANFVEFENSTSPTLPDNIFEIRGIDASFNDRLAYKQ